MNVLKITTGELLTHLLSTESGEDESILHSYILSKQDLSQNTSDFLASSVEFLAHPISL